jgi:PAT family beta-lactamase induction signal transducer AmpG
VEKWLESIRVYADRRMAALLALGFASGLPRLLVYSTLTFWLLEEGLKIESVGLFAATALPYNLKFLWAPLLDRLELPMLGRWLGLRRGWLFVLQIALALAILGLSQTDPGTAPVVCAVAAIVVSTLSASQDVVIDAYRVEILDDDEQGAGAAVAVFGYRVGMLVASAGALYLAAWNESWPATYAIMAAAMGVGLVATLLTFEPTHPEPDEALEGPIDHIRDAVISPFVSFSRKRGWALVLLFVLLYKLGDALAGTMTNPFLVDLEFTKTQIADIAKTYGLVASIVGVLLGGTLVRRAGIIGALWAAGFVQMASNFMFSYQAWVGNDTTVLIATIGIEQFTGGLATAAFVAYLSALCDKRFTATQYALLTAFSSLLQTLASTSSGYLVSMTGWFDYFIITAVAAVPGLIMLYWMQRRELTGLDASGDEPDQSPDTA